MNVGRRYLIQPKTFSVVFLGFPLTEQLKRRKQSGLIRMLIINQQNALYINERHKSIIKNKFMTII